MDVLAPVFILSLIFFGISEVGSNRAASSFHKHRLASTTYGPTIYDVRRFGAVGDGKHDDTEAFELAWKAACIKGGEFPKISVAAGKTFLVSNIDFEGPCTCPFITFEILGRIIAPAKSAWGRQDIEEWLNFREVDGLSVVGHGRGIIDGRGATWWENNADDDSRPTALRFSNCNKLYVGGLKHINSQRNHISITGCIDTTITNLQLRAPEDSPNTDGINISGSTNIRILDSLMATGDDCIAINGGTSNVLISNIKCGPGHGISIGSLGKKGAHDEVERIKIMNSILNRTDNGVRIKTWQGGSGFARDITFSNITFIAAKNPIIINQYYCPHKICANRTSAVKVSNVRYFGLHGTSIDMNAAIDLSCSETVPCTNIQLENVDIKSDIPNHSASAYCINVQGRARAVNPTLDCTRK